LYHGFAMIKIFCDLCKAEIKQESNGFKVASARQVHDGTTAELHVGWSSAYHYCRDCVITLLRKACE